MPTMNGWLARVQGNDAPILSKTQREMVQAAVYDRIMRMDESAPVMEFILEMINRAMANVPDTRSCLSCDFYGEGDFCSKWQDKVPAETIAEGCDSWQDDGVPF